MNLNKRVKRTFPERIEHARAVLEVVQEIDQHDMPSRQKEHTKAIT